MNKKQSRPRTVTILEAEMPPNSRISGKSTQIASIDKEASHRPEEPNANAGQDREEAALNRRDRPHRFRWEGFTPDDFSIAQDEIKWIKACALSQTLTTVLKIWYPRGEQRGKNFQIGNIAGDEGKSLRVNLEFGVWKDFGEPKRRGGDIIRLNQNRLTVMLGREVAPAYAAADLWITLGRLDVTEPQKVAARPSGGSVMMPVPETNELSDQANFVEVCNKLRIKNVRARYAYRSAVGRLLMYRLRCEDRNGKYFQPLTFNQESLWQLKDGPPPRPLYGLDRLAARPEAPVLIVEGEKTADAATGLFSNYVSITWPGGVDGLFKSDFSPVAGRDVVLWPDADAPGKKAMSQIENILAGLGVERVRTVDTSSLPSKWDLADEVPEGIDLLLLVASASHPTLQNDSPPNTFLEPTSQCDLSKMRLMEALNELNRRHFIATEAGKTRVWSVAYNDELERFDHVTSTFEDIRNRYMKYPFAEEFGRVKLGHYWLTWPGRRDYDKIVFSPNGNVPRNQYNLWRGFVIAQRPGDWSLFRNHLQSVVCRGDPERFEYLMGWIATLYQRPDLQAEVAIVLKGKKGTGKSIVGKAIARPLGQHAIHIHNQKYVTGSFNAHLRDAVFVIGDEAFWAGDKHGESVLKGLITDDRIIIEGKGRDAIAAKNRIHLLLISNDDWVIPASLEERRFFVLEVSNDKIQDHSYFGAIQQQLETGGYEAMLYDLLRRDITHYNIRDVPHTEELTEQKLHSLDPFKAWWYAKLKDGAILADQENWDDPVQTRKVFEDYTREVGNSYRYRAMVTQFGIFLKKVCPRGWPKKYEESFEKKEEGDEGKSKTIRLWFYRFPPLDECRRTFESLGRFNEAINWDDDVESEDDPI